MAPYIQNVTSLSLKCCLAEYKKLLVLFFPLHVKLFRLAVSRRFLCLSLLSVREDNSQPSSIGGDLNLVGLRKRSAC